MRMKKIVMMVVALASMLAMAFPEVPKASAKALGVTKGKPFSSGVVFVNGKYIEPPYTVERWGTGIRINQRFVTGQVIDWNEFLKTQEGVKITKSESAPPPAESSDEEEDDAFEDDSDDEESSLDDLFDDDPKPKKESKRKPVRRAPPKPKVTVTYSLDGEFVKNDATTALTKRINDYRTDIDKTLRAGGFICFGSRYSAISGDERIATRLIDVLPEIQQKSATLSEFKSAMRAAGTHYLNDLVYEELYKNRIDYRKLQERRNKFRLDKEWSRILEGSSND